MQRPLHTRGHGRRALLLLLLLPLTMAPKIAWTDTSISVDLVTPPTAHAGRPIPVVMTIANIDDATVTDLTVGVSFKVTSTSETYDLVRGSAGCEQGFDNSVSCTVGDLSPGEVARVRFVVVGSATGPLTATPARLDLE